MEKLDCFGEVGEVGESEYRVELSLRSLSGTVRILVIIKSRMDVRYDISNICAKTLSILCRNNVHGHLRLTHFSPLNYAIKSFDENHSMVPVSLEFQR